MAPGLEKPGLRPADVVMTSATALCCAVLLLSGRWVPGWERSALAFAGLAAGLPLLRFLASRLPRARAGLDAAASFWLGVAAPVAHQCFGPVVDVLTPRLYDRQLALWDLRLFHAHPSAVIGRLVP
ncbi:MAG TPA: phosphatidic acid phosphatase, partial [Myxococcales bacterium]|nr:phosphatidic acid phosphatase [Myxococcales bacterium]